MTVRVLIGDCRARLRDLAPGSVHCVVTSPPYFGLRDYQTGTWEGGDPSCEHVVGRLRTGANLAASVHATRGDAKKIAEVPPILARDLCPHCGARRTDSQIGQEASLQGYVDELVGVFREVWRVLRDDGTVFLNLGDSYSTRTNGPLGESSEVGGISAPHAAARRANSLRSTGVQPGLKHKDLMMVPARVALALQADGWWLRSDIIWAKPNPMPESVTDRPTSAHEHVFLLTKSGDATFWTHRDGIGARSAPPADWRWLDLDAGGEEHAIEPAGWADAVSVRSGASKRWRRRNLWEGCAYFWDAEAVREASQSSPSDLRKMAEGKPRIGGKHVALEDGLSKASAATNIGQKRSVGDPSGRNVRNVWEIASEPYSGAHFATMPTRLVARCIQAGTSERGGCAACGAPWVRRVVQGDADLAAQRAAGGDVLGEYHGQSTKGHAAAGVQDASAVKARILAGMRQRVTVGWSPTCGCGAGAPVVPCTVLDPFGGAGTTGLVADRLGRSAVLVELNADYARMAVDRIRRESSLLARVDLEG